MAKKEKEMKRTNKIAAVVVLALMMVLGLSACGKKEAVNLWDNAKWTEDATLGEGSKTVQVEIEMEEKSITLTIASDKALLGDILLDHEVIEGEMGAYGMYIKSVNGVQADYDVDQAYWAVYQDGEYLMTGVDSTEVSDGAHYELVYTKE